MEDPGSVRLEFPDLGELPKGAQLPEAQLVVREAVGAHQLLMVPRTL